MLLNVHEGGGWMVDEEAAVRLHVLSVRHNAGATLIFHHHLASQVTHKEFEITVT